MKYAKDMIVADVCSEHAVVYLLSSSIREMGDVQKVTSEIDAVVDGFDIKLLVINFSKVHMLSSSFLGKLIGLSSRLKERNIAFRVCCLTREVRIAFKLLNLHKLLKVYPTEEKALR